ncbi:MAG: hypothetical protein EB078_09450, partial [Proteobacteria bacterium]|nr:hypothetical protein [Pseudomonadota bacterium]NDD05121.1 hypothetical protein [Pseudomonadota bacterium]
GGRELALIHNFRSEPGLLDTINFLSEHLFENQSFSWVPMLSGTAVTNKSIAPFRLHWYGPNTKTTRRELQQSEIPAVVTEIESLLKRGIAPGSIAILSRNTDRITEFAQALKEKGIPVRCKQTEALTHQLDVLDVISFLQCVAAPLDDTKLIGFLRSSFIQFSYQQILNLTLQRTVTNKTYEPLIHVLLRTPPQELTWFVDLLNSGESLVERCLLALFTHANYFPQNQEAFNAILKPLSQPHLQLFEIQADLQAWRDSELLFNRDSDFQESPTSVQLMTVHASKGLEFDFVFLVDGLRQLPQDLPPVLVKPGLPPGIRFWQNNEKIMSPSYQGLLDELRKKNEEEARRILYVAITRARKELHFFAPHLDSGAYPAHSWAQLLVDACLNWENGRTQNKPRELPGSTTPSVSGCTT